MLGAEITKGITGQTKEGTGTARLIPTPQDKNCFGQKQKCPGQNQLLGKLLMFPPRSQHCPPGSHLHVLPAASNPRLESKP